MPSSIMYMNQGQFFVFHVSVMIRLRTNISLYTCDFWAVTIADSKNSWTRLGFLQELLLGGWVPAWCVWFHHAALGKPAEPGTGPSAGR